MEWNYLSFSLKFGNGHIISSHSLPGKWLFIHAEIKLKHVSKRSPRYLAACQILIFYSYHIFWSLHWYLWTKTSWWRYQMETFSALLAICARNSPVPGEFPTQRPVTRSFDVFFDLCPYKRLSKQWWRRWFETPSCPLWRQCYVDEFYSVCLQGYPRLLIVHQTHLFASKSYTIIYKFHLKLHFDSSAQFVSWARWKGNHNKCITSTMLSTTVTIDMTKSDYKFIFGIHWCHVFFAHVPDARIYLCEGRS